jgi:hypothetical protein
MPAVIAKHEPKLPVVPHTSKVLLAACTTFMSNLVLRFHEYAAARLDAELTVVEHRRRALQQRRQRARAIEPGALIQRPAASE